MKTGDIKKIKTEAIVSVLIANLNNAQFLHDSIGSVLKQSFEKWELVFIDDGSTDDSVAVAREYAKRDGRIRVQANGKNYGCGYAKRQCIALSHGEICGFLDSDDVLDPGALSVMASEHERNVNAALVYSDYYICGRDLDIICKNAYHQPGSEMFLMTGIGVNHFATFKRSYYNKTSGINKSFKRAVDRDLYLKLEEVGSIVHVPKTLYYYRIHGDSISTMDNSHRAEYWAWQARFDACERRGLDKEAMFNEVMKAREMVANSGDLSRLIEYRLGSALLVIPRLLRRAIRYAIRAGKKSCAGKR